MSFVVVTGSTNTRVFVQTLSGLQEIDPPGDNEVWMPSPVIAPPDGPSLPPESTLVTDLVFTLLHGEVATPTLPVGCPVTPSASGEVASVVTASDVSSVRTVCDLSAPIAAASPILSSQAVGLTEAGVIGEGSQERSTCAALSATLPVGLQASVAGGDSFSYSMRVG